VLSGCSSSDSLGTIGTNGGPLPCQACFLVSYLPVGLELAMGDCAAAHQPLGKRLGSAKERIRGEQQQQQQQQQKTSKEGNGFREAIAPQ
jgi:hypothetical protein